MAEPPGDNRLSRTWTCLRTVGDEQARLMWGEIFTHYQARLAVRVHCRMPKALVGPLSVYDVLQESYLRAFELRTKLTDPSGRGPLKWLSAITDRVLMEMIDRETRRLVRSLEAASDDSTHGHAAAIARDAHTASQRMMRDETVRRATLILDELDPEDRDIILRISYEGWSHHDVARRKAITVAASRKRLARARRRLEDVRARLDNQLGTVQLPHLFCD